MDSWYPLRAYTKARIAQGSAGNASRTESLLDFQIAHAEARDAVWKEWDCHRFVTDVRQHLGNALPLETQAQNRAVYLQRPDLGRRLDTGSREILEACGKPGYDVAMIVSNGLSATAVETHALSFLGILAEAFKGCSLSMSPTIAVPNGRVALSDEIGLALGARASLILIGERPGLSAADSLGAYITLSPAMENTDAERNCLSNIREPDGLDFSAAANKICYLILKGLRLGIRGVALKDDSPDNPALLAQSLKQMISGSKSSQT